MASSSSSSIYDAVEADSLEKLANSEGDVNFLHSDKQLPDWDADAYLGCGRGNSAFHLACWIGSSRQVIDRLLALGANVHLKSSGGNGYLPLHCASYCGNTELVALLLDLGCDPNATEDCSGASPLSWASSTGRRDVAELLLNRGAIIHQKDKTGWNAFHYASSNSQMSVCELLLDRGTSIHEKDNEGWDALMWASFNGSEELVEFLLDQNSNIHEKDNDGFTCLHKASQEGYVCIVDLLLSRGANIYEKSADGKSSLELAKISNHCGLVQTLERWPVTMCIVALQVLNIYNQLDVDCYSDLFQFIGTETDYL